MHQLNKLYESTVGFRDFRFHINWSQSKQWRLDYSPELRIFPKKYNFYAYLWMATWPIRNFYTRTLLSCALVVQLPVDLPGHLSRARVLATDTAKIPRGADKS